MPKTTDPTDLQSLPSIGPSLAQDLRDLGYREPADLQDETPERMYEDLCEVRGVRLDRCVLYSFRCAVNAATHPETDAERRKWWNWMDSA
jgi:hypothetical protein